MKTYDTLVEALNDLKKQGYTVDFNLQANCIQCGQTLTTLAPDEFEIVGVYRFEGMNDPSDSLVLYVIESHHGMKGTLINAYGVYSDSIGEQLIRKLAV